MQIWVRGFGVQISAGAIQSLDNSAKIRSDVPTVELMASLCSFNRQVSGV
jgi:hypothetical protein